MYPSAHGASTGVLSRIKSIASPALTHQDFLFRPLVSPFPLTTSSNYLRMDRLPRTAPRFTISASLPLPRRQSFRSSSQLFECANICIFPEFASIQCPWTRFCGKYKPIYISRLRFLVILRMRRVMKVLIMHLTYPIDGSIRFDAT